jgi:hypothetical protein
MSSEADQAAAAKWMADEAAAAAASANWPTGGYYMLIHLLLISMCIVLAISVDVSTICLVLHSYMIKYQYVHIMLMFYSWINIIGKLPKFLTSNTATCLGLPAHNRLLSAGGPYFQETHESTTACHLLRCYIL